MQLADDWSHTFDPSQRRAIWREMLDIHADQQYAIGILSEAPQPVVVSKQMRNVPETGIWAFEPGAHFGIHRIDEFYYENPLQQVTQ